MRIFTNLEEIFIKKIPEVITIPLHNMDEKMYLDFSLENSKLMPCDFQFTDLPILLRTVNEFSFARYQNF